MQRFQLYLTKEQRGMLDERAKRSHQDVSDLIRTAIDRVYGVGRRVDEFGKALDATFGMLRGRRDIRSGVSYQNKLRMRWERPR